MTDIASENEALAHRVAKRIVERCMYAWPQRRHLHLSVSVPKEYGHDSEPPPFAYHWHHKELFGVSYPKADRDAAEQWTATALLAGYKVIYGMKPPRHRWGGVRTLADGDYIEDRIAQGRFNDPADEESERGEA